MTIDQEACLFSGSSHSHLAQLVANHAQLSVSAASISSFPDSEISVEIQENVRGKTAFVVQSLAHDPHYYLMELLVIVDALKRASAKSVIAIIPYMAYARQDRKGPARAPITARLVANLLETAGVNQILTMDLHSEQMQGFFNIPTDHLYAQPALLAAVESLNLDSLTIVAPDIGSVKLAKKMADALKVEYAVIDKRRLSAESIEHSAIIGDVKNRTLLFVDDLCSTAHTLCEAAKACKLAGANQIYAVATHGLFVKDALARIEQSSIEKLFVTDTIASQNNLLNYSKIKLVSIAHLFGEAIQCVLYKNSMSSLFTP